MTKTAKRNTIVSAILAIMLCISLMAGATFALFTSESKVNIAVTSGKVSVVATTSNLKTYSGVDLTGDPTNDTVELTASQGTFTNGGTAVFNSTNGNTLELDKMTPGDKVTFDITITNYSNVNAKYRTILKVAEDGGLFSGLKFKIGGTSVQSSTLWANLEPVTDTENGTVVATYQCSVELPSDKGNEYQNKSCKIAYTVEAIQGNALTVDTVNSTTTVKVADTLVENVTLSGDVAVKKVKNNIPINSDNSVATKTDENGNVTETKPVATAEIPEGTYLAKTEDGSTSLTLSIEEVATTTSNFTITTGEKQVAKTLEVELKGLAEENEKPVKIAMYVGKGLTGFKLYHTQNNESAEMKAKASVDDLKDDQDYYYDSTTGYVTMLTAKFSPFTYVCDAGTKSVATQAEFVAALADSNIGTIVLGDNITIDSNDYYVIKSGENEKRLYVDRNGLTIDLNQKTLTVSNCALTITGNNVTIKNGNMVATTVTKGQTKGSYTMQVYGKNVLVEGVIMTGGVNVSGSNSDDTDKPDASVTITNCDITATNYYTVCAQRNSATTIKDSTLTFGNYGFFWCEKVGYYEGSEPKATVDSKLSYENVTFKGEGNLYNQVGVAPIEITADGNVTYAHDVYTLEKALADESIATVKLADNIELTSVLGLAHSLTIDFCGKTINASGDMINKYQHVIQVLNTKTSANKLTFKDSVGGGEFKSSYGGIRLYSSNASFELNDVTMTCTTGEAIAVAARGYYIVDDDYEMNNVVENTSIVINSGKIVCKKAICSGNDYGGKGHKVTINGGSIECNGGYSGIFLNNNCVLTINNCDFKANNCRPFFVDGKDNFSADNVESSVVINNINFTGTNIAIGCGKPDIQYVIQLSSDATGENVVIYKGTFIKDGQKTIYDSEYHPYGKD